MSVYTRWIKGKSKRNKQETTAVVSGGFILPKFKKGQDEGALLLAFSFGVKLFYA